jgi:serine phosphatase RsbU (regulator of sigma subunit)
MKFRLKFYFFILLLPLSICSKLAIAGNDHGIDSIRQSYKSSTKPEDLANMYYQVAKLFNHEDNYDSALYNVNAGIKIARQEHLETLLSQLLRTLGNIQNAKGDYKKALSTYKQALKIDDSLEDKTDACKILNNIGVIEQNLGDFSNAYSYYTQAIALSTELNDKKTMSECYNNIGILYRFQGNDPKAIEYNLMSLKIEEELNEPYVIGNTLNNIGNIYEDEKERKEALGYYTQAADKYKKAKSKRGLASVYGNIGLVYSGMGDYDKALEYFTMELPMTQAIDDKRDMSDCYNDIGSAFMNKNEFKMAFENYQKSLDICNATGDKEGVAVVLNNIGSLYYNEGKYPDALKVEEQALNIAKKIKSPAQLRDINGSLSKVYEKTKQTDKAFESYKAFIMLRDSLNNEETSRKIIKSQLSYQFDKEQQAQSLEQEKKDAIAAADTRRQRTILIFVIGFLILALLFAVFMVNRFIVIRKQKKTIEEQKVEVENKNKIIEEKNKDITDSINYARDIQRALLPAVSEMKAIFPESFVLYMPKDIVSGDFYWMVEKDGRAFLMAADCTGHGVPGALMSMIGVSLFNEAVEKKDITQVGDILNEVRKGIIQTFRQKGESQHKDGMDAALCCIDLKTLTAEFAGAYNPLWLISPKGEMKEISADKQPVGIQDGQKPTFTTQALKLEKGDTLYLFTDGFADQFGGPNGKKFKYKQFQEKLISIVNLGMDKQKQELEKVFTDWKGSLEQVDDVLIIGVRV